MDDNNEEPVTEIGVSREVGNQCTGNGVNNDSSGAGANASSRTEMIFVTATPLSELVWSPDQGVSLKCADCSSPEKRLSFLCGIESNNMVLQPPVITIARESNDHLDLTDTNLSSSQIKSKSCKVSEKANLVGSPRSTAGTTQGHPVTSDTHNHDKKGKNKCFQTSSQSADTSATKESIISRFPLKSTGPDADNGRSSNSSSIKMYEPKSDLAQNEPGCGDLNRDTSSGPVERSQDIGNEDRHIEDMKATLFSEGSTSRQSKHPDDQNPIVISEESKKEEFTSGNAEDGITKMSTRPPLRKQESTAENDLQALKGESVSAEIGFTAPKPADQSSYHNERSHPQGVGPSSQGSPGSSRVPIVRRKYKGKGTSNEEHNENLTKDEDGSHESVESCNSTGLLSLGKRKRSFEQQMIVGSKQMKQKHHESSQLGSLNRQDSSFMNWISNMVKGLSKSNSDESPALDLTLRSSHHGNQTHEANTSFQTIFKALYCSSSKKDSKVFALDNNLEDSMKELANSGSPAASSRKDKCTEIVLSTAKFNRISDAGEGPSTLPNFTSSNICVAEEDHMCGVGKKNNFCNIPSRLKKVGELSSNSSFQNDSESPSEGKEACEVGSVDLNKSVMNKSNSLASLWITRFSPKGSDLKFNSSSHHQIAYAPLEADSTKVYSHIQNCVVSVRDPNAFEDSCKPSTSSFGLKRKRNSDEKRFKSNLNPIHISQRFKNSEALASVFAKRLDTLRHIIPSQVASNTNHKTTSCFFCGVEGHRLQDCPEITGSEIEDLLTKVNSYEETGESSCLCISCFQLNHWAISCPNSSWKKGKCHAVGSASFVNFKSFRKVQQIPGNGSFTNSEFRKQMGKKDLQRQVIVGTNVGKRMNGKMILNERTAGLQHAENEFCDETSERIISKEEFTLDGKQTVSGSTENGSKENQITSFCNIVNRHILAVPREIFAAVKSLRLSRTDILKWKKSTLSFSCLDGFFLRLRLRKWEEGLGGTGYFVACISGPQGEGSFGSPKSSLIVNIAGLKCLIESRFISNNDFTEDELMAWWCATLRGGNRMPSEEDLKAKLVEKRKLGF